MKLFDGSTGNETAQLRATGMIFVRMGTIMTQMADSDEAGDYERSAELAMGLLQLVGGAIEASSALGAPVDADIMRRGVHAIVERYGLAYKS